MNVGPFAVTGSVAACAVRPRNDGGG